MPPNLLLKAAFVRGELESIDAPSYDEKELIRTDFILQNVYAYLLRKTCDFDAVRAKNKREDYVLKELEETLSAFISSCGDNIKGLCLELEVSEETIGSVILGVSNELFCEGITWSRIIALFTFIGELTLQCLSKRFPEKIVDEIYECFCKLVKENLKGWIDDHGGWEGLTALSLTQGNINSLESPKLSNSGWAKSLLYSTVRMVGTLAHIANSSSHALP